MFANGVNDIRSITGGASNANQPVGGGVCRCGATTNSYTCGTITKADYIVNFADNQLFHQWETSFGSQGGDSGGPVMYNFTAFGILSGSNGVRSNYGTIDEIRIDESVRPCYTAACG